MNEGKQFKSISLGRRPKYVLSNTRQTHLIFEKIIIIKIRFNLRLDYGREQEVLGDFGYPNLILFRGFSDFLREYLIYFGYNKKKKKTTLLNYGNNSLREYFRKQRIFGRFYFGSMFNIIVIVYTVRSHNLTTGHCSLLNLNLT